jgi:hypothetical protein
MVVLTRWLIQAEDSCLWDYGAVAVSVKSCRWFGATLVCRGVSLTGGREQTMVTGGFQT